MAWEGLEGDIQEQFSELENKWSPMASAALGIHLTAKGDDYWLHWLTKRYGPGLSQNEMGRLHNREWYWANRSRFLKKQRERRKLKRIIDPVWKEKQDERSRAFKRKARATMSGWAEADRARKTTDAYRKRARELAADPVRRQAKRDRDRLYRLRKKAGLEQKATGTTGIGEGGNWNGHQEPGTG